MATQKVLDSHPPVPFAFVPMLFSWIDMDAPPPTLSQSIPRNLPRNIYVFGLKYAERVDESSVLEVAPGRHRRSQLVPGFGSILKRIVLPKQQEKLVVVKFRFAQSRFSIPS